jgi:hypothetical protein
MSKTKILHAINTMITILNCYLIYKNVDWENFLWEYIPQILIFTILYVVYLSVTYWDCSMKQYLIKNRIEDKTNIPLSFMMHLVINQLKSMFILTILVKKVFNPDFLFIYSIIFYIVTSICMVLIPSIIYDKMVMKEMIDFWNRSEELVIKGTINNWNQQGRKRNLRRRKVRSKSNPQMIKRRNRRELWLI